jgi:hypothetical protein
MLQVPSVRRFAFVALLVCASGLMAFLAAEVVMRFAADRILSDAEYISVGSVFLLEDSLLGYSLQPGSTRIVAKGGVFNVRETINTAGLRDAEHTLDRAQRRRRILVLGDSFMYGDGVGLGQTLATQLEGLLPGTEVSGGGAAALRGRPCPGLPLRQ